MDETVITEDKNTFLQNENDRKIILKLYKNMIEHLPKKYSRHNFVASVLEVYPNKDKTGGHARRFFPCRPPMVELYGRFV